MIAQTVSRSDEHSRLVASDYDRRAIDYDRRWRFYTEGTLRETIARFDLPDGCSVLDLGCGTGSLIVPLSRRWLRRHVVGVDISQQTLDMARHKLRPEIGAMATSSVESATSICGGLIVLILACMAAKSAGES